MDGLDLVGVEIELGRLLGNRARDLGQLGVAAADDGAGAGALAGAVVVLQAAFVALVTRAPVKIRTINEVVAKGREASWISLEPG